MFRIIYQNEIIARPNSIQELAKDIIFLESHAILFYEVKVGKRLYGRSGINGFSKIHK